MKLRHLVAVGTVGLLVAAGCGDENETNRTAASKSDPAAAGTRAEGEDPQAIPTTEPDGPYVGAWFARLSRKQALEAGDPRMAGTFRLKLRRNGTYTTFQELDGELTGRYAAASGNRLVFGEDEGCKEGGFGGKGVYSWSIEGGNLRLKALVPESGGCTGRTQVLTYPAWQRR